MARILRFHSCLFVVATLVFVARCPGAVPVPGGDDLDERLNEAIVAVRADRPWRTPGAPSLSASLRLDAYDPAAAAAVAERHDPDSWGDDIDSTIPGAVEEIGQNFDLAAMERFEARRCKCPILFDVLDVGQRDDATCDEHPFPALLLGCGDVCRKPNAATDCGPGLLAVDQRRSSFDDDVNLNGPYLGAAFRF